MTRYIGLSTSGHDPAIAVVGEDGAVLFAESTERLLQDKRAWGAAPDHPAHLSRALAVARCEDQPTVVATSWARSKGDAPLQFNDLFVEGADARWMQSLQARTHAAAGETVVRMVGAAERRDYEHHLCHAAFACWTSPFEEAVCLVSDGEGDVGAVSAYRFADDRLQRLWRSWGPGSLGAYYSWLTTLCGFDWKAGEEWKVMGLAAFGQARPELCTDLSSLMSVADGKPKLAADTTLRESMQRIAARRRRPGEPLMAAADLAASGQATFAAWTDRLIEHCMVGGSRNLVLSGGCALNSAYNGTIAGRLGVDQVHVPCAPADDGNAVGAALLAWMQDHPGARPVVGSGRGQVCTPFLGQAPDQATVATAAAQWPGKTTRGPQATGRLVEGLAAGRIYGVMRGRAEFGPRALGHRSILADPRRSGMKDRLNLHVKGREPYRPFAPMVPLARIADWFEHAQPSPYMSLTLPWKPSVRDRVPAVVHEDGSGRLQTVCGTHDAWQLALLEAFEQRSGIPILLNTSFNVMGKPIIDSAEHALAVLTTTGLDGVLLEDTLLEKH